MTVRPSSIVLLLIVAGTLIAGCAAGKIDSSGTPRDAAIDTAVASDASTDGPSISLDGTTGALRIDPASPVLTLTTGAPIPTQTFTAMLGDRSVPASWSLDRGELGAITASDGVFTPTGSFGGALRVLATYGAMTVSTEVTVRIVATQNGDPNFGTVSAVGPSGYGGVGGDGPGGPVSEPERAALTGTPSVASDVRLLYPYDGTVWPRGLLPPLFQWDPGAHSFGAVRVRITEANYEYEGFFGRPSSAVPFRNLPIPQEAWRQLTYSNGGEDVLVSLTFAEGENVYGPYEMRWKIAPASLRGTVYYNSYGTALVTNYEGGPVNGGRFGGATLAIKPSATVGTGGTVEPPQLIAGATTPSGNHSGCRVCHSVSANGSVLMTQHGNNYGQSSFYGLTAGGTETPIPTGGPQGIGFSALYPDGTMMFTASGGPLGNFDRGSWLATVPEGTTIPTTGIPEGLKAGFPAFSPDGKHVAFTWRGTGADNVSLAVLDYDDASKTFSNFRVLHTPLGSTAVFPSFLPSNDGIVYSVETGHAGLGVTTNRSELWWVDLETATPVRLDGLNGFGTLPLGPNGHDHDETLNYEPTVNPIASGGYVWVVFTTRRMYGNVADIAPMTSDPRVYDWLANVTTKKLWVAAFDLNAPPGTDPSHPAFYLPAQELHGSNARGYWTVDPCHSDGTTCATGDECCGGYCRAGEGGALVCSSEIPICAQVYERCTEDDDCCGAAGGIECIGGVCTETLL